MVVDPNRVQSIVAIALGLSPDDRSRYVNQECGGEEALLQHVEKLLGAASIDGATVVGSLVKASAQAPIKPSDRDEFHPAKTEVDKSAEVLADLNLTLSPASRSDSLGRLRHYEILEVLGKGGCGLVLKAFDDSLQRMVAIKTMLPEMSATSPARKRFLREARAAAAIRTNTVVQIYAVEELPTPFLVMEYIPGENLQENVDRVGPLDVKTVLRIGHQIALGLSAAHAMNLIHRDIKPANILLEKGPAVRVKITDFGLARTEDDASLTQTGMVAGTPMYMAPEQARGESIDHRADLFSLGSVLYMMVTGRAPFRASNALAVIQRVAENKPRAIREIIPETPLWLCAIIQKLHATKRDDRFSSAAEVASLFKRCLDELEMTGNVTVDVLPGSRKSAAILPMTIVGAVLVAIASSAFWLTKPEPKNARKPLVSKTGQNATPTLPENPPTFTNTLGMRFARIPKGKAWIGDQEKEIPYDFYLSVYEVTNDDWDKTVGANSNPSQFVRNGDERIKIANIGDVELRLFPVEGVSWKLAKKFVDQLNEKAPESAWRYRLPTNLEWEYACRGGPSRPKTDYAFDFYIDSGDLVPENHLDPRRSNFRDSDLGQRPCKIGRYPPNRLGLYDMHGNVLEMMEDRNEKGQYTSRGGGFDDSPGFCRAGLRRSLTDDPTSRFGMAGIRVARVPVAEKAIP